MRWRVLLAVPVLAAVVLLAGPMALLAGVLLLPAMMAWAGDAAQGHHAPRAVLLFGIAAATPSLIALWATGDRLADAIGMSTDLRTLAFCWAIQAGAWLLAQLIPVLLALALQSQAARRQALLHARRDALESEWH